MISKARFSAFSARYPTLLTAVKSIPDDGRLVLILHYTNASRKQFAAEYVALPRLPIAPVVEKMAMKKSKSILESP